MTVRYANHDAVVEAGDVYDVAPGHSIQIEAGAVLFEFSPLDEWKTLLDEVDQNVGELLGEETTITPERVD